MISQALPQDNHTLLNQLANEGTISGVKAFDDLRLWSIVESLFGPEPLRQDIESSDKVRAAHFFYALLRAFQSNERSGGQPCNMHVVLDSTDGLMELIESSPADIRDLFRPFWGHAGSDLMTSRIVRLDVLIQLAKLQKTFTNP